jgi:hypothetical protein
MIAAADHYRMAKEARAGDGWIHRMFSLDRRTADRARREQWQAMFRRLESTARHGFPVQDGSELEAWVYDQRRAYRDGVLNAKQARSLEAVPGWSWQPQVSGVPLMV